MCALLCTDDDDVYELLHARINQSFLCMLHPSCQQMDTSGTTLGVSLLKLPPLPPPRPSILSSLSVSLTPPSFSPRPFELTEQREKLQSYTGRPQNLAAGSGSHSLLL